MIKYFYQRNLLNLIFKSPFDIIGDNLLRYFVKQIIKSLEILDRGNFAHFDLKPGNILTFLNLNIKLSDFGFLTNLEKTKNEEKKVNIPGGTPGYLSPEYYLEKGILDIEHAKKQDFFSLGAIIFFLKFGEKMLDYIEDKDDNFMTSDIIIDLLEKTMDEIKSNKLCDKEFINLLCSLIQYKPNERPDLEKIYRNKWLNKNSDEIEQILEINELDEKKIALELNKSDFLIKKNEYIKKSNQNVERRKKFIFKDGNRKY